MQACPGTIHLELHSRMPQSRCICMCACTPRALDGLCFELPESAVEDQNTPRARRPCCKARATILEVYNLLQHQPTRAVYRATVDQAWQPSNYSQAASARSAPYLLHHAPQRLPYSYMTPNPALPTPQVARSPRHACKRGCWRTATPGTGVTLGGLGPTHPCPRAPHS